MPVKTTLKKWIYILSVFVTIIQTHFLCHIRQTTLGLNPKNHIQVQKEKNTLWSLVYFLHQMWKKAFLCHIHAVMEKKLTKAWSMCRAVVLIIKPKCFFHILIPVTSSDLKVPTVFVKSDNFETMPQGIIKRSWVITRTVQIAVWDKTEGNLSWFSLECFCMLS